MAGLLVFVVTFALYVGTSAPGLSWLDSPEFAAQAASLGVAHSPGHPLPGLIGRLATLIPIGDQAWRANIASAACSAAAASCLYIAARDLSVRILRDDARWHAPLIGFAMAMAYGLSTAAWAQAVRAEVYALQSLLVTASLAALVRFDQHRSPRHLHLAGLLGGLALANHHFIAIVCLAPAAVFVLLRMQRRDHRYKRWRAAAMTAVAGLVGLCALAYLPVRSQAHPIVNWGAPHTLERFTWTVSAKAFRQSLDRERVAGPPEDAVLVSAAILDNPTPLIAVLAIVGIFLGARRPGWRALTLLFIGTAVATAGARVLVGFEPAVADHHAYLLPAIAAVTLLAAGALATLTRLLRTTPQRSRLVLALPVVLLIAPWQFIRHSVEVNATDDYAADSLARWELAHVPPRSIVILSYNRTSFRVWALQTIDQARPDLIFVDSAFLTYPGTAQESKRRHRELAPLVDAPLRITEPLPIEQMRQLAHKRPVFVQLAFALDRSAFPWLLPRGAFAQFSPNRPSGDDRARLEALDQRAQAHLERDLVSELQPDRVTGREAVLYVDFMRLMLYCQLGRRHAAQLAFARARRFAPHDTSLRDEAKRCGLMVEAIDPDPDR